MRVRLRAKAAQLCTTRRCCSIVISGNIGSASTLRQASSLAGKSPSHSPNSPGTAAGAAAPVIDFAADLLRLQVAHQGIALTVDHADNVLVEHVSPMRPNHRALHELYQVRFLDQAIIALGGLLTLRRPLIQVGQLHAQHGGLQGVDPGIPAQILVVILRLHAVDAQAFHVLRPVRVVGDHHAGIAVSAEVLGRIETETTMAPRVPVRFF